MPDIDIVQQSHHIAISLLSLSPYDSTGGFIYVRNLLDTLFPLDTENSYHLLVNARNRTYFKKRYGVYPHVSFSVIDIRADAIRNPLRALRKLQARLSRNEKTAEALVRKEVQRLIDKKKIDIIFFPAQTIYPRALSGASIVTTVYDLQHEYLSEHFSPQQAAARKENSRYAAEHSDRLIAISRFTKETIMERYAISGERIPVVYFGPPMSHREDPSSLPFTLPRQFLLYPAALWPHKNHALVLEALAVLKDEFPYLHVMCTGVIKKERLKEALDALAKKEGISDRVHFPGYVSDEALAALYKSASALVFPSSFEGFGLPILEAFSYGVPVIAANNSSISEIVRDAGLLFETNDLEQFVAHVRTVLTDMHMREQLIERGWARAEQFSWRKAAEETLGVFKSLYKI